MQLPRLALCLLLAGAAAPSYAVGRLLDVSILDRDTGAVLPVHEHHGEYWVAGTPGSRYAIVLRNRAGGRLLAVTSVDGVNVLSGETAGWDQTGYVLSQAVRYQVTGWRKSHSSVAAFAFSNLGDSYAARTGRPDQVGVIGVAVFRERRVEPVIPWSAPETDRASPDTQDRASSAPAAPSPSDASRSRESSDKLTESADNRSAPAQSQRGASPAQGKAPGLAQAAPASRLGTAHGARETSWVSHTAFARQQSQPDDIVRIRYDSTDNLIASGVIPATLLPLPWPRANPFPASEQATYVPDPPAQPY